MPYLLLHISNITNISIITTFSFC